jgi:hypothetical protein
MKKSLFLVATLAAVLILLVPGKARLQESGPGDAQAPPPSEAAGPRHPKIESDLWALAQPGAAPRALQSFPGEVRRQPALNPDQTVRVVIELEDLLAPKYLPILVQAVSQQVAALGGRVETSFGSLVQASVPPSALLPLASQSTVRYIRRPLVPHIVDVVSEGVSRTGANLWIDQPSFHGAGTGIKVCILDLGFEGYQSLEGSELPDSVTVKSFRFDGDIEAGEVHGAACAEIVHDMVPEAQLYLVNFNTDVEQHNAVSWIIQQGVKVISYSIGWTNAGAGDGTGPIDVDVAQAASHDVAWAGSAGNEAENHYRGAFSDPDHDGWHNFTATDEILEFEVPAYEITGVALNWDDWGVWNGYNYSGADQDYDLYLYIWNGLFWQFVDSSNNPQTGFQWPTEDIYGWYSDTPATWGIAIRKVSTTRNCLLELFTMGNLNAIEHDVPAGSISVPADSPNSITAGAVSWSNDAYHYYSSQGPTHDGRIKPDFAAPSGVSTRTYGTQGFYGTSASAPHVAGAFGLMMSRTPYSLADIYQMLRVRAVDLGAPGKDNVFGWGRLNLRR